MHPHPTPSPAPSPAPGKRSTVAACMLRGSCSLEKINHSDRPVFIICQLCKTLFNFGGEKPELLKNQSGDEVSLEGGIIKGQMTAFRDTAARTWGGAHPRQPGRGAGRGRSSWTAPGGGRKRQRHRESLVRTPEGPEHWLPGQARGGLVLGSSAPNFWVWLTCRTLVWAYLGGWRVRGGRKMAVGWRLLLPSQAPGRVSVSLPGCVGDACASASGL